MDAKLEKQKQLSRPRFIPVSYASAAPEARISSLTGDDGDQALAWLPLIYCSADFPLELFETAISQLIHHPEYNSTLILRSETVSETTTDFPECIPRLQGLRAVRNVHRKLLPRRPGRDSGLEQHCTLYASTAEDDASPSTLVLSPIVTDEQPLPYYHPAVSHIAFRYVLTDSPVLQIEAVPLPGTQTDISSRLYRTCLALLDTLHRYGWGALTHYQKRVKHDCIIPRETYQDLYLIMRERHKHLVDTWQEVTDPRKHVFEDIGIATFLMLLWKDMYGSNPISSSAVSSDSKSEPWRNWPRPPAGFLDLGCGNGLLTHILSAEGYQGLGIDLRARTSWSHYPETTQAQLRVEALDPTTLVGPSTPDGFPSYLKPGVFVIGNHADELTPWVPVLSTLCSGSGYLSIPCCAWTFDMRYERSSTQNYPFPEEDFIQRLNLGGEGSNTSSYSMYRIWLASLSAYCGWKIECETLRIPSTRNWAIIGRARTYDPNEDTEIRRRVEEIVENVQERGLFRTRTPEGKAGEH
ncbi:DUF1613-domain-containing protein [Wolfiporia cocos MD-104 SS10]|uniref:tRNA (uracil-O(2)-)-methyltransferase n=1 Tax=Wolfiporia cocos (strain MD-104) TaxID=742152 RepID=A0A2H3J831_WOLCO|nr:DUF1613-domain-containing protein [Wolfiporia cocos MD-104 SS10]